MQLAASSWLDRLFGLSRISLGDADTVLGWRYALPAWAWALIVLGALGLAVWSYSRLLGPRSLRMTLAGVRALLLILVAALLAGPTLVRHDERVERDWLLTLVDRSASMQVQDKVDAATGEPVSRDAQLRRAIRRQLAVFEGGDETPGLEQQRHLDWLGFGAQVRSIGPARELDAWPEADEPATHIRTAIEQALRRAAGQPISGIVLFSDGRSPQATDAELVHRLQQRAVPVFAVPLGADPMPLDLAVGTVDHPVRAFVDDIVPVSVTVNQLSGEEAVDPQHVRVRLADIETDEVLDETTLAEAGVGLNEPVRLTGRESEVGERPWRIEVRYENPRGQGSQGEGGEGADGGELVTARELVTENNQRRFNLDFIDRPIRVLYVEGYPRWEYRYLNTLLVREDSVESSMLLLSADRDFAQEGDIPITRLPMTAEEIEPYDVVILGDVPANYFSSEQIALLRDHVAANGAGLIWLGGERHTPASYADTPLASLLPMRQPGSVTRLSAPGGRIEMRPTPMAHALNVLALHPPTSAPVDDAGGLDALDADTAAPDWPEDLPPLYWAQSLGALKPTAEPLAVTAAPGAAGEPEPMVVRLRYGAGQSIYLATDESWRWRYGRGEWYYQQYWLQLLRKLGRARVEEASPQADLRVSQQRVDEQQPVVVELTLRDPALLERDLPRIALDAHRASTEDRRVGEVEADAPRVDRFELRPVETEDTFDADDPAAVPRRVYRATWQPTASGLLELRANEPALAGLDLSRQVEVVAPDDELRRPQPDHDRLARLAEQTGGAVIELDELHRLAELVPNRERRLPTDVSEPIGNSALALILILGLLTLEWVLRKVIRLV